MSTKGNTCPYCSGSIVRHIRQHELYWFCLSCRQEVPMLTISRLPIRAFPSPKLTTTTGATKSE